MPLQLLKLFFLIAYFSIHSIIPSIGVPWEFNQPTLLLLQKFILAIFALLLFHKPLLSEWLQANKKKVLLFSILFILLIIIIHIFLIYLLQIPFSVADVSFHPIWLLNNILFVPFIEELAYRYSFNLPFKRGFKQKNLPTKTWSITLLLLSSWFFAYGHLAAAQYNLILLIPFIVMGFILGLIYWIKDNIWYSLNAHVMYNGFVVILSLVFN